MFASIDSFICFFRFSTNSLRSIVNVPDIACLKVLTCFPFAIVAMIFPKLSFSLIDRLAFAAICFVKSRHCVLVYYVQSPGSSQASYLFSYHFIFYLMLGSFWNFHQLDSIAVIIVFYWVQMHIVLYLVYVLNILRN